MWKTGFIKFYNFKKPNCMVTLLSLVCCIRFLIRQMISFLDFYAFGFICYCDFRPEFFFLSVYSYEIVKIINYESILSETHCFQ
jgi:hypothetical protein